MIVSLRKKKKRQQQQQWRQQGTEKLTFDNRTYGSEFVVMAPATTQPTTANYLSREKWRNNNAKRRKLDLTTSNMFSSLLKCYQEEMEQMFRLLENKHRLCGKKCFVFKSVKTAANLFLV